MEKDLKSFSLEELEKEIVSRKQSIAWAKGCLGKAYLKEENDDINGTISTIYMPVYFTTDNEFLGTRITIKNHNDYLEVNKEIIKISDLLESKYITWEEVRFMINNAFEEVPFLL